MSTSRLEKFIYAICSMEVSDLPAPLSRIEILWNCLITGETPDFEPQSRNEQYLMAMLGLYELDQLPTPMSRGEKLLYKIAMGETDLSDIPAYLSRYEELLGYLAENGGVGDFEYILQTLNQRLSTLYSTKEQPMKQAVIKGDTLVNELPRPSLKNTMMNVESQKLNKGYDNGKTLVNIHPVNYAISMATNSTFFANDEIVRDSVQPNTKYIIRLYNTHESITRIYFKPCVTQKLSVLSTNNKCAIFTTKETLSDSDLSNNKIHFYSNVNITLDDVKNTKILICEYQDGMENWDIPYFEGTKTFSATPNVVDGEFKQAVVKGQTLVNLFKENSRDTAVDINYRFFKIMGNQLQPLKGNSQYTLIFDKYVNGISTVVYKTHANSLSTEGYQAGQKILFTTIEDVGTEFHIFIKGTTIDIAQQMLNLHPKVIILEGDYTNVDIPYFEGMQSVQLSEVTTTGKNLYKSAVSIWNNNQYIISGTSKDVPCDTVIDPSTKYVLIWNGNNRNGKVYFFSNGVETRSIDIDWWANSVAFTTNENENGFSYYIRLEADSDEITYTNFNVQLEYGSVATPYEPYQSNTLTLAEPVNLRKVGDVEDEFDALTGQVTERVGEMMFDGSDDELWKTDLSNPNNYKFLIELPNINCNAISGMITEIVISDKFPSVNNGDSSIGKDVESVCINGWANGNLNLSISKTKLSDGSVEALKTYLQQNPFTVQYQLATPTTKTINPTITDQDGATQTKLHSFNDGYLSVSSQGLLPSVVDYEVPTNNSYYLPDMLTLGAQYTSRGSADCNATIDGKLLALGKNRTFTTPSSVTDRLMVLDTAVDDLMFIKGDQTTKDFGYFEGMKSVGLSNKMPVLTTVGKNLLNNQNNSKDTTIDADGTVRVFVGRTLSDYVKVSKSKQYAFSGSGNSGNFVAFFDNSKTFIERISAITFTPKQDGYIRVFQYNSVESLYQIEEGSTTTSYEPYKSNILSCLEPVELGSVGEVKDELNLLTQQLTQRTETRPYQEGDELNSEFVTDMTNTRYKLAQEVVKTVDLTTVDQDGQPTKLKTFDDISYVEINADPIIPSVDLEVATKINEALSTMGPQQLDISNTQNKLGQTIKEQTENTDATMMATTEIYEQTL